MLNAVFETGDLVWQSTPWLEGVCDSMALATYRSLFPQLWEDHDLIVHYSLSPIKSPLKHKSNLVENYRLKTQLHLSSPLEERHTKRDIETQLGKELPLEVDPKSPQANEHQPLEKLSYVLRLFVAGHNANTERILQTLHQILEQSLLHPYTLKVVDVFKHPEQAEADSVSATPTLVKVSPSPTRRLVGDLDNATKILQMLASPEI